MLTLIQDVLTDSERKQITEFFYSNPDPGWIDSTIDNINCNYFVLDKILKIASEHFDLSKMVGCECWAHFNTGPPWHIDQDDELFHRTGEIKTPICSIVYYPIINNLIGGKFITKTESITPIANSLLIFAPRIEHAIEQFNGNRASIAINPWDYKIRL